MHAYVSDPPRQRLDEGPTMMVDIFKYDCDSVETGMKVQVTFMKLNDDACLPLFEPA